MTELYPSQRAALSKLCEEGRTYAALWAEPRSGKTAVALRWVEHVSPRVVVVVAPLIAQDVWKREATKWLKKKYRFYSLTTHDGYIDSKLLHEDCINLFFVNYDRFGKQPWSKLRPYLKEIQLWSNRESCMILDESHVIKSPSSVIGRNIRSIARWWEYRLIITGTPVTNPSQIDSLYGQWCFLNPGIRDSWPSARNFRNYFGEWTSYRGFPELVRPIRQAEMHAYFQPDVVSMAGKKHSLSYKIWKYSLDTTTRGYLETLIKEGLVNIDGHTCTGLNPLTRLIRARMIVAGWCVDEDDVNISIPSSLARRTAVLSRVLEKCEGKSIVCCTHLYEIELVSQYLTEQGVSFAVIKGGVKDKNRIIETFQHTDQYEILIVQPTTVAMAVDISVAEDLIWYSCDFNYVTFKQTSDRIKLNINSPKVHFICAKHSPDELVWITMIQDKDHLKKTLHLIKHGKFAF